MAAIKHEVETTYINSWVESGVYELVINQTMAGAMRRHKIDLVDINYVLRSGRVVHSDMLERRGLWDIEGITVDGVSLIIRVAVVSSEYEVELLRILNVERSKT